MKPSVNIARLFLAGMIGLPIAVLTAAHGLSSARVRSAPELSAAVFPFNGLAHEQIAYDAFAEDVKATAFPQSDTPSGPNDSGTGLTSGENIGPEQLQQSARTVAGAARRSLAREPLLPKSYALLALAESDPTRKRRIIELASVTNRRELALQGLVLQQMIDDASYSGTIETLDQILRVHPERRAEFFPLLATALKESATIPIFTSLFSEALPWRDAFLIFAVGNSDALSSLSAIRGNIALENPEFDKRLVAGLAGQGDLASAAALYGRITASQVAGTGNPAYAWASDYPPFDWNLSDQADLRAQTDAKSGDLEISVMPGTGGILASRLYATPAPPFTVRVAGSFELQSQAQDVKLGLTCWGETGSFYEADFNSTKGVFKVNGAPGCRYMNVTISARSWTGGKPLIGLIGPVRIASGSGS